jgi:hypothetical protein
MSFSSTPAAQQAHSPAPSVCQASGVYSHIPVTLACNKYECGCFRVALPVVYQSTDRRHRHSCRSSCTGTTAAGDAMLGLHHPAHDAKFICMPWVRHVLCRRYLVSGWSCHKQTGCRRNGGQLTGDNECDFRPPLYGCETNARAAYSAIRDPPAVRPANTKNPCGSHCQ